MSVKVMGIVWDLEMGKDEKLVLLAYADHANHEGINIFPSIDTVAKKTGYSRRSVQRITEKLIEHGFLLESGTSVYSTNMYIIPIKKLMGCQNDTGDKNDTGGVSNETENVQECHGGGVTMTPKPLLNRHIEPSILTTFDQISKAFWSITGIPEPAAGGRGWTDWEDGTNELLILEPTVEEMQRAKQLLDERGFTYTTPHSFVKTIANMRQGKKKPSQKLGGFYAG